MCGILLYMDKRNGVDLRKFHEALSLQSHRGPDDEGVFYLERLDSSGFKESFSNDRHGSRPQLVLGHKRLSIIDLTNSSKQPIINNLGEFLLYNGEFYNYKEFASQETKHSDALTLFDFLNQNSVDAFDEVNGMWASIYGSIKDGFIFLSRDRYGKKPLYYYQSKDVLIVSSEIKSIFYLNERHREVEPSILGNFIYGKMSPYPTQDKTFYKDIYSVCSGENLKFDLRNNKLSFFSNINFSLDKLPSDVSMLEDELVDDLESSIGLRMESDVKTGVLVSGGVDSSLIAGVIAKAEMTNDVEFYTCHIVGDDFQVNEDLIYSRILAKKLKISLNEIRLNQLGKDAFIDVASEMAFASEIPINYKLSSVPTYLIAKEMRSNGVGVAIDGVGGDEILGGYPSYQSLALANIKIDKTKAFQNYLLWLIQNNPRPYSALRFLGALLGASTKNKENNTPTELCRNLQKNFMHKKINEGIANCSENLSRRNNYATYIERQLFEISEYQLPYYLGTADTFNMWNSIENRSPFLDKRLYKYLFMPEKYKRSIQYNKYLLRKVMPENIPPEIRWRKGKLGIGTIYNEGYLYSKEAQEIIKSSNFVRSILSDLNKDLITENKHLFRSLFSVAILDNKYPLSM